MARNLGCIPTPHINAGIDDFAKTVLNGTFEDTEFLCRLADSLAERKN